MKFKVKRTPDIRDAYAQLEGEVCRLEAENERLIGQAARLRALARALEDRYCAPSLQGYGLADGLEAAADLIEGYSGPMIHPDEAVGVPLKDAPLIPLTDYRPTPSEGDGGGS